MSFADLFALLFAKSLAPPREGGQTLLPIEYVETRIALGKNSDFTLPASVLPFSLVSLCDTRVVWPNAEAEIVQDGLVKATAEGGFLQQPRSTTED